MLCAAEGLFRARKINRRSTRASQRVMAGKGQQHDIADGSADHVNPGRQVRLRLEGDIDGQYTADVGQQNGPRTRAGYPATTQTLASARLTCYLATSTRSARVASMALTAGMAAKHGDPRGAAHGDDHPSHRRGQGDGDLGSLAPHAQGRTEPCDAA